MLMARSCRGSAEQKDAVALRASRAPGLAALDGCSMAGGRRACRQQSWTLCCKRLEHNLLLVALPCDGGAEHKPFEKCSHVLSMPGAYTSYFPASVCAPLSLFKLAPWLSASTSARVMLRLLMMSSIVSLFRTGYVR